MGLRLPERPLPGTGHRTLPQPGPGPGETWFGCADTFTRFLRPLSAHTFLQPVSLLQWVDAVSSNEQVHSSYFVLPSWRLGRSGVGPRFCSCWALSMTPTTAGSPWFCPAASGLEKVSTRRYSCISSSAARGSQGSQAPAPISPGASGQEIHSRGKPLL